MISHRITQKFHEAYPPVEGGPTELFTTFRRPTRYALRLAIQKAGSEAQLGIYLGVSQQAVHKWVRREADLPVRHWEAVVMYAQAGEFL